MTFQEERCPDSRHRLRRVTDRGDHARGIAMDKCLNVLNQQRHDFTCLEECRDLPKVGLKIGGITTGVIVKVGDFRIRHVKLPQGGQVAIMERSVVLRRKLLEFLN